MMKRTSRGGFTLVELLMVIVMLSIVLGALFKVIVGQQRFYRGASDTIETQDNVRQAVDILATDLRGISPSNGDIFGPLSATSIEFMEPVGASVVCVIDPASGRKNFTVPPLQLAANNGLTSWGSTPKRNDIVLVYNTGKTQATVDDTWESHVLDGIASGGTCPNSTELTTTTAEQTLGWTFQLNTALAGGDSVAQGAAVRIVRRVRYQLYQASDGQWYLGYQECPNGTCDTIQPVSGPYLPPSTTGPSGLALTYFDNTGLPTVIPSAVARIDVVTRAQPASSITGGQHVDSLRASIALRN